MDLRIWKEKLETVDLQEITIPKNSQILTVQIQNGEPYIWFKCDINNIEYDMRMIRTVGTGNPNELNVNSLYIGTYQLRNGAFVGHVFDEGIKKY